MGSMDKTQSFKLLDAYYDAGGNFNDTANSCQDEQSEKWIGEWMNERQNRDLLVLATTFTTSYRSWELGEGKTVNYSGNHRHSIYMSVRDSLEKLQTEWIDILYLHWWNWTTSIEEVMDALHILVEQGKVLYLGISDSAALDLCLQPIPTPALTPRRRSASTWAVGTRCTATWSETSSLWRGTSVWLLRHGTSSVAGCSSPPKGSRGTQKEQRKSPFHDARWPVR
jgi:hypothetical protein